MRSFRTRAAPTAMSPTIVRAGPAPITGSPGCTASMSSGATTAVASAIPACVARAVISPAIPASCMDRREPRTGAWRRPRWCGGKCRRPKSAPRSRIPSAPADARSRRSPRMCATTGWSAGDGIPAPAANPLPARPSRPTARSRTGPRPGRLARPIDPAMNFCDYFASCCCCRRRNLLTRPCARVEDGFAHAHIRGCAGNKRGVEPAPRIG